MSIFGRLESLSDVDAAIRDRLASSFAHILDKAAGHIAFDRVRGEAALQHIRRQRQDPGVFARYYDLVFAITANQLVKADTLLNEIIELSSHPASFAIVPYDREHLGSDYDRFPQLLFSEYSRTNPMASPSEAQTSVHTKMLQEALEIVSHVDKVIYDEITDLLVRIYLAVESKDPIARHFGGGTSFFIWGSSFINIQFYKTAWGAVQFLVHEVTHALLFALSFEEPLVQNSPDESYESPLRSTPRPMDGILHATLVCARLVDFNQAWLESGVLQGEDRKNSEATIQNRMQRFKEGLATIEKHGKLSERARRLVNRCRSGLEVPA